MIRLPKIWRVVPIVISIVLQSSLPYPTHSQPRCGTWQVSVNDKDPRIKASIITSASGADCHGALRLSNGTGWRGFGGYTLELRTETTQNASFWWEPALAAHGDQNSRADLLPSLDIRLHAVPDDTSSQAYIHIQGAMTFHAWKGDVSLFLLETALDLSPLDPSCLIQEEQLLYSAISVSSIVGTTADLALKGDWLGARQEFSQVAEEFYTQAGEASKEIGVECAGDALKGIAKKPALIAMIGLRYITWVPVAIYDYFKYQGHPSYVAFEYAITPTATPVPPTDAPALATPMRSPTPAKNDQADLAVTDFYPYYGPKPNTVHGSPIGTVFARIENNGPGALTDVSVPISCTSNLFGQTWTDSRSITKKGVIQLSLVPGQSEDFNTWIFVHSADGSWFEVTCSISVDNDPKPSNNAYTKRLP